MDPRSAAANAHADPDSRSEFHAPTSAQQGIDRVLSHRRGERPDAPNPRSYAARVGVAPSDSLPRIDTTNAPQHDTISKSAHRRRTSVVDQSPLQQLELKLGDLSKEEKRARMQEAERRASQRSSAPAPASSSSRRPRVSKIRPDSSFFDDSDDASTPHASPSSLPRQPAMPAPGRQGPRTLGIASTPRHKPRIASFDAVASWQRSFGRMPEQSFAGEPDFARVEQAAPRQETNLSAHSPSPLPTSDSQATRHDDHLPEQTLEDPPPKGFDGKPNRPGLSSMLRRLSVRRTPHERVKDSGHEAVGEEEGSDTTSARPLRRYEKPTPLSEWSMEDTLVLDHTTLNPAARMPVDSSKAWWENGKPQSKGPPARPKVSGPPSAYENAINHSRLEATKFQPPLLLKCGPLLRFTGIQEEEYYPDRGNDENTAQSNDARTRSFWTGSVLIVTDDQSSSYSSHPSIRLFKQNMDLDMERSMESPDHLPDEPRPDSDDAVTGQAKCSPNGETLYVRPIHKIDDERHASGYSGPYDSFQTRTSVLNDDALTTRVFKTDGEKFGFFVESVGYRIHAERGYTFWRFKLRIELASKQCRIAYRINHGPAIGFWVPAQDESMNIMYHNSNGFSLSVDADALAGADPLWRDVLNKHQRRPFHVMLGGGDQIYNDAVMKVTENFAEWLMVKSPHQKHATPFSVEMQEELESFYLDNYCAWFSQGLFGLANSQIPMVNMWDDHDIIDGFGSYPAHFMQTPAFSGIGAVAHKYYLLFQHHTVVDEPEQAESLWIFGVGNGPYITEPSRSIFMSLGADVRLLALDCRTERTQSQVLSEDSWHKIFQRCYEEIQAGHVRHLLVLSGVPVAYPRLNFLENVLTSRMMDPVKAMGRSGALGSIANRFDGSAEVLDDLNDHWTAKNHKVERNWFVQQLQDLAAEASVRITIVSGDVHLAAVGRFKSQDKAGVARDHDHRYIPNIISSAIANSPPPDFVANMLNRRNKVHHLDDRTIEDMVPMFLRDVNGLPRNNHRLLPRRNWCAISKFAGQETPPQSPAPNQQQDWSSILRRSVSLNRSRSTGTKVLEQEKSEKPSLGAGLLRRLSFKTSNPPSSWSSTGASTGAGTGAHGLVISAPRLSSNSLDISRDEEGTNSIPDVQPDPEYSDGIPSLDEQIRPGIERRNTFHRQPNHAKGKHLRNDPTGRSGFIDLTGGLEVALWCEIDSRDPAGRTVPYRFLIPALWTNDRAEPAVAAPAPAAAATSISHTDHTSGAPLSDDGESVSEGANDHVPGSHLDDDSEQSENEDRDMSPERPDLARSQPSDEVQYHGGARQHTAGQGPQAPPYVNSLPASVRKRYSQFEQQSHRDDYQDQVLPLTNDRGSINRHSIDQPSIKRHSIDHPSIDRSSVSPAAQADPPRRSNSLVDRLRRRLSLNKRSSQAASPIPPSPPRIDHSGQGSLLDDLPLGPLTSHSLDGHDADSSRRPQTSSSLGRRPDPYTGPGHQWNDRGGLPLPRPVTLAMSDKAARQLGNWEHFGGDWLNRSQGEPAPRGGSLRARGRKG